MNLSLIVLLSLTDKAYLAYDTTSSGSVILHHTEVPSAFRGKGVAKILAKVSYFCASSLITLLNHNVLL